MSFPNNLPKKIKAIGFLFVFCCLLAGTVFAARVKYVIDGDTFILEDNQKIRMIGINAPEVDHPKYRKKGQRFGKESKVYLRKRIQGKDVKLKKGLEGYDRYGRRLAYVYLPDGTFVNREMVLLGYAETFRRFPFEHKEEFLRLERDAQTRKLGLWSDRPPDWFQSRRDELAKWFQRARMGKQRNID